MKFSQSLQFNASPEYCDHYIAYSNLKKLIYRLEKRAVQSGAVDGESAGLISEQGDIEKEFIAALEKELSRVVDFYKIKEVELLETSATLIADAESFLHDKENLDLQRTDSAHAERQPPSPVHHLNCTFDEEESHFNNILASTSKAHDGPHKNTKRHHSFHWTDEEGLHTVSEWQNFERKVSLKKRLITGYIALVELQSYTQLDYTGFSKILKKFDKVLGFQLRDLYLTNVVQSAYPWQPDTRHQLKGRIDQIRNLYASLFTHDNTDLADKELRLHVREEVVWGRNTVWRDMIGMERRTQAAHVATSKLLKDDYIHTNADSSDEAGGVTHKAKTSGIFKWIPSWFSKSNLFILFLIIAIPTYILQFPVFDGVEQNNCFAMLVLSSLLWATEIVPLFVTSLSVPLLVVLLRVLRTETEPYQRLSAPVAAKYIFSAMWTPVVMLLLGGFTLAAALSKFQIAKLIATWIMSKAGQNPHHISLVIMCVAAFLSMWISNVAAPVLCLSIIQPLLRTLPTGCSFAKSLVLGVALASNIGGMISPIASPQNVIALENMQPALSWVQWFLISIPICTLSILLVWCLLLLIFPPPKDTVIAPIRTTHDKFTGAQYFISAVTLLTIFLWCIEKNIHSIFGDMGVIAIIPIVLFFGTGILTSEDFNNFLWTVIMLAMGGIALGKAVYSSGLLHSVALGITQRIDNIGLFGTWIVLGSLTVFSTTFISHTVGALIILPVAAEIGQRLVEPHPNLLVMGCAFMCSASMGLPMSGFPNMTAFMLENEIGKRYLHVKDFLKAGIPASLLTYIVVSLIGYVLMKLTGL